MLDVEVTASEVKVCYISVTTSFGRGPSGFRTQSIKYFSFSCLFYPRSENKYNYINLYAHEAQLLK